MTLTEIRAAYPSLFYAQSWFNGHEFMDREQEHEIPRDFAYGGHPLGSESTPVYAVDLAATYVADPHNERWSHKFFWTDDEDDDGNRIYVAGSDVFGCDGFQIHRLLLPDHRWRYVWV